MLVFLRISCYNIDIKEVCTWSQNCPVAIG